MSGFAVPLGRFRSIKYCRRLRSCESGPSTWTLKDFDTLLPAASLTLQLTDLEPIANVLPEDGEHDTTPAPTLSEALTLKNTTVPLGDVAFTEKSAGTFSTGDSASRTLMVWLADAEFPDASRAVHVIVVTPTGKRASIPAPSLRTGEYS